MKKRKKKQKPQEPASETKEAPAVAAVHEEESHHYEPGDEALVDELAPAMPETEEPTVSKLPVPMLVIVLLGILLFVSDMYLMDHSGGFDSLVYYPNRHVPNPPGGPSLDKLGAEVYTTIGCVGCHQADGNGSAAQNVPPLAGSEWVLADGPERIARIVMHGLNGPIEVKGKTINNQMLPFGDLLTDEKIAAVLTFIRTNEKWGNNATPVTPEKIAEIRKETEGRAKQWTAPELLKIPVGQ